MSGVPVATGKVIKVVAGVDVGVHPLQHQGGKLHAASRETLLGTVQQDEGGREGGREREGREMETEVVTGQSV